MLRFLTKVAFLANIVFALVFAMHWIKNTETWDQAMVSHLVITAYFIATPLTLIINIWILVYLISSKPVPVAKWLQVANALFFVLQILYFQFT